MSKAFKAKQSSIAGKVTVRTFISLQLSAAATFSEGKSNQLDSIYLKEATEAQDCDDLSDKNT